MHGAVDAHACTCTQVLKNIIPVTVGNIIAGAGIFAASYSYLYGALGGHTKD